MTPSFLMVLHRAREQYYNANFAGAIRSTQQLLDYELTREQKRDVKCLLTLMKVERKEKGQ